jgi:Putative beta-barrel porin-2, OmpL-like. bbp2
MRPPQPTALPLFAFICACLLGLAAQAQDREEKPVGQVRWALASEDLVGRDGEQPGPAGGSVPHAEANHAIEPVAVPAEKPTPSQRLARVLGSATLSGSLDVHYGFNFNQPAARSLAPLDAPANQFALNLAELMLDRPAEAAKHRLGYRVAFTFGQAMDPINAGAPGDPALARYLKEAYFSYRAPVGSGLNLDLGRFVTPAGAEVIESKDDWNHSRGLLFTYAIPFSHVGLRARYAFNSRYSLTAYVVNGWNNLADNNRGKTLGASFAWTPSPRFGITQSYLAGPETRRSNAHWRQLSDTVVTYSPSAKLSLMLNHDYGRGDFLPGGLHPVFWTGAGGYARYRFSPRYAIATRYEYYDDHEGFTTGTPQHLHEVTQTVERLFPHSLLARVEFRHDWSSAPAFHKGLTPVDGQTSLAAGLVYQFSTAKQ